MHHDQEENISCTGPELAEIKDGLWPTWSKPFIHIGPVPDAHNSFKPDLFLINCPEC